MPPADKIRGKPKWRWPQFSLREMLVVTALMAALWGFLSLRLRKERDELICSVAGSFVLLWGLLCWRTVRMNPDFFRIRKKGVTCPTMPEPRSESPRAEYQFGLQAFLLMFVVVALLAGYLRTFGPEAVGRFGLVLVLTMPLGGLIGWLAGRFSAAVFWAGIGTVLGTLAVCGAAVGHWTALYAWPLMGGMAGAAAAVCDRRGLVERMACGAMVGLGIITIYVFSCFGIANAQIAELICAAGGGALLGLGVDLVGRFEKRTSIPRHFLALGLVVLAIAGHWIAVRVIPGVQ